MNADQHWSQPSAFVNVNSSAFGTTAAVVSPLGLVIDGAGDATRPRDTREAELNSVCTRGVADHIFSPVILASSAAQSFLSTA
jgi:hypothetical protein